MREHALKQDYVLKKHVKANSAAEALGMDTATPVHEVFMIQDKPEKSTTSVVGFFIPRDPDE